MADAHPILDGAEPLSAAGGPNGALVVHGFTGNPQSMRGLAQAFAAAGFTVELPRLPGHGTALDDMLETDWRDWSAAAEAAYADLAGRCERVVVAGLSMGGTLTLWLALQHPEIAALALVNPAVGTQESTDMLPALEAALDAGQTTMPGIGSDIAKPDVVESAYNGVPIGGLKSLMDAALAITPRLGECKMPAILFASLQDHVVPPSARAAVEAGYGGPLEVVELARSFHVATLDHEADVIEQRAVAFAESVLGVAA